MGTVRNRVRLCRAEKQMTQEDLADSVGVTRQTIGLIEKERYNPTIGLCLGLCRSLGKTLDELFWMEANDDTEG
ncbi:MAG: transcriptional regulator [Spirochaetaceae bacterium]|nr:MAG: transcriptional regulator [Spirochaetaceae bacterium]TVR52320.1 MAG: transcriptional regulator [Spirochaetaceae bacterium]